MNNEQINKSIELWDEMAAGNDPKKMTSKQKIARATERIKTTFEVLEMEEFEEDIAIKVYLQDREFWKMKEEEQKKVLEFLKKANDPMFLNWNRMSPGLRTSLAIAGTAIAATMVNVIMMIVRAIAR